MCHASWCGFSVVGKIGATFQSYMAKLRNVYIVELGDQLSSTKRSGGSSAALCCTVLRQDCGIFSVRRGAAIVSHHVNYHRRYLITTKGSARGFYKPQTAVIVVLEHQFGLECH